MLQGYPSIRGGLKAKKCLRNCLHSYRNTQRASRRRNNEELDDGSGRLVTAGSDPFFSWWRKDVEDDGIFYGFGRVGEIAGDDKHIAGADNPFFS